MSLQLPHCLTETLSIGCVVGLTGCSQTTASIDGPDPGTAIIHYVREITLDPKHAVDAELGIRLVEVRADGSAMIHVKKTDEILVASPGEPFLGKPHGIYTGGIFGHQGLILNRSDPAAQLVVLERRDARSK